MPKNRVILKGKIADSLDAYEGSNSNTGVNVYKSKKEEKKKTFADIVGDDVFFETDKEEEVQDTFEKRGIKLVIIDIIIILGLLILIFALIIGVRFLIS